MSFEVKLKIFGPTRAKFQKKTQESQYNDSWMKFSKGGKEIRILYKGDKWMWNIYSKEKIFWEDEGCKLIRVRSKAQAKSGKKLK